MLIFASYNYQEMKLDCYTPVNKQLSQYIEAYYFISPEKAEASPLHYFTFPNNFFIVSISQGAKVEISNNRINITGTKDSEVTANYVSRYITPIEVTSNGNFNEITMYFKPLAINHFIAEATNLLKEESEINFNPFPDFLNTMTEIFLLDNREEQKKQLEEYWLSKLLNPPPSKIHSILSDIESDSKIEDIAAKHGISRQYLNKIFLKSLGKSPSEYRKIHRFRKAINEQKKQRTLTELSHQNLFYDQSHLIKDFKQLTRTKPNSFFKQIDPEKKNIWLYL